MERSRNRNERLLAMVDHDFTLSYGEAGKYTFAYKPSMTCYTENFSLIKENKILRKGTEDSGHRRQMWARDEKRRSDHQQVIWAPNPHTKK